ncbi:MAG: hypothetical protein LBP75_04290 [Planctomycetota bacterium]|nr:hypothetical protein [Planctomycetota bacterium]
MPPSANWQTFRQYIATRSRDNPADHAGAMQIFEDLQKQGLLDMSVVLAGNGRRNFMEFLLWFWDYEKSEYVRSRHRHNHSLGKAHCYAATRAVRLYWQKRLAGRTLGSIARNELESFALDLSEQKSRLGKPLSPKTVNNIMSAGTTTVIADCQYRREKAERDTAAEIALLQKKTEALRAGFLSAKIYRQWRICFAAILAMACFAAGALFIKFVVR